MTNNKKFIIEDKFVFWTGLIYFAVMLCFVVLKILNYNGLLAWLKFDLAYSAIIQIGIMFLLPLLLYKFCFKQSWKNTAEFFSFRAISFKSVVYSILLGICVYILVFYTSNLWTSILMFLGYNPSSLGSSSYADATIWTYLLAVFASCVLPGVCEETSHRGLLFGSLKDYGVKRAILISALLFGLMHFNVIQFGYAFIVGIILAFLTVTTKSIFPAMIVHFMNNFISTTTSYVVANNWLGSDIIMAMDKFFTEGNFIVTALVSMLILFAAISLGSYLIIKLFGESKIGQFKKFKRNLQKEVKGTPLEEEIDFNNPKEVFAIYQQTSILNMQQELQEEKIDMVHLMKNLENKGPIDILLADSVKTIKPVHKLDNIFIYCAIFLGAVGTFLSYFWGVL
ncbi:MAG: CPBP family intramembrane metalloprotease [Clostridia bacterium]|nr:CPBP family intramembrane metalloprotease [Clostridia bacterium]